MNTQNHPHSQMRVRMIFYFSIRSVIRCLHIIDKPTMPVAATLRYGDLVLEIHNGIDKYVLYILMKELQEHVG